MGIIETRFEIISVHINNSIIICIAVIMGLCERGRGRLRAEIFSRSYSIVKSFQIG